MDVEILKKSGIDYDSGVRRFVDDAKLYENMLETFLEDETFANAKNAFNTCDLNLLFEYIHSMKGISGSLDMTLLYRLSGELTELLRNNRAPDKVAITQLFEEFCAAYGCVCDAIRKAK